MLLVSDYFIVFRLAIIKITGSSQEYGTFQNLNNPEVPPNGSIRWFVTLTEPREKAEPNPFSLCPDGIKHSFWPPPASLDPQAPQTNVALHQNCEKTEEMTHRLANGHRRQISQEQGPCTGKPDAPAQAKAQPTDMPGKCADLLCEQK